MFIIIIIFHLKRWGGGGGGILLRFLSALLVNPEHQLSVMGCDTPVAKDFRLSNTQQTTNPLIARPLSEKY